MHVVNGGTERRRRYSKVGEGVEEKEGGGAEGEEGGEYGGEEGQGRGRACLVCVCVCAKPRQSTARDDARRGRGGLHKHPCSLDAQLTRPPQSHVPHHQQPPGGGGGRELSGGPLATVGGSELGDDGGRGAVVKSVFIKAQSRRGWRGVSAGVGCFFCFGFLVLLP